MRAADEVRDEQAAAPEAIGLALHSALASRDVWVRSAAVDTLPACAKGQPEWADFVARASRDRSPMLRANALAAIARLDWLELADCVAPRLADPAELVRVEAVETIEWLDLADQADRLVPLLHGDRSCLVRGYAGWALIELRGEAACDEVASALAGERSPWARAALRRSIYPWRPEEHLDGLLRSLRSRDHRIVAMLCNHWPEPDSEEHQAAMARALRAASGRWDNWLHQSIGAVLAKVEAATEFGELVLSEAYLQRVRNRDRTVRQ